MNIFPNKKLVVIFILFNSAMAHAIDGNELLSKCLAAQQVVDNQREVNTSSAFGSGVCLGFTQGVQNALQLFPKETGVCFPKEGVNSGQSMRIVLKYLQQNPELLHQPDSFLAVMAFKKAYPCR